MPENSPSNYKRKSSKIDPKVLKRALSFGSIFLVAIGIVAVSLIIYSKYLADPAVYAKVGSKELSREDIKKSAFALGYLGTGKKESDVNLNNAGLRNELTNQAIKNEIIDQNKGTLGITVSDAEIDARIKQVGFEENYKRFTPEEVALGRKQVSQTILEEKLESQASSWYQGKYILLRFDKYFEDGSDIKIKGKGEQRLITAQKAAAAKLANDIYQKLQNNQITFAQAQEIVLKDSTIGQLAFSPLRLNMYGDFTKESYAESYGYFDENYYKGFREGISGTNGKYSKPALVETVFPSGFKQYAFAIFEVDSKNDGKFDNLNQWYKDQYNKLGAKSYLASKSSFTQYLAAAQKMLTLQKAYACGVYASGHLTNIQTQIKYVTSAGGYAPMQGEPMNISSTFLRTYGADCSGGTDQNTTITKTTYNTITDSSSNIWGLMNMNDTTDGYAPALLDCGHTSYASVKLSDPLTNSMKAKYFPTAINGRWQLVQAITDDYNWNGGFSADTGTQTIYTESPPSANGATVIKRYIYTPTYAPPPLNTDTFTSFLKPGGSGKELIDASPITTAQPGDTIYMRVRAKNVNSSTVTQIWVRDNINNNGFDNTAGSGTVSSPYSIRNVIGLTTTSDLPTTNSGCVNVTYGGKCGSIPAATQIGSSYYSQGAGTYLVTDSTNKLLWRSYSTGITGIATNQMYSVYIPFTIPSNSTLIGKFIGNNGGSYAQNTNSSTDPNPASYDLGPSSLLKIVGPSQTLTINITPQGSGYVSANGGISCDGTTTCVIPTEFGSDFQATAAVNDAANWKLSGASWSPNTSPPIYTSTTFPTYNTLPTQAAPTFSFIQKGNATLNITNTTSTATLRSVISGANSTAGATVDNATTPNPKSYLTTFVNATGSAGTTGIDGGHLFTGSSCTGADSTTTVTNAGKTVITVSFGVGSTANVVCTFTYVTTTAATLKSVATNGTAYVDFDGTNGGPNPSTYMTTLNAMGGVASAAPASGTNFSSSSCTGKDATTTVTGEGTQTISVNFNARSTANVICTFIYVIPPANKLPTVNLVSPADFNDPLNTSNTPTATASTIGGTASFNLVATASDPDSGETIRLTICWISFTDAAYNGTTPPPTNLRPWTCGYIDGSSASTVQNTFSVALAKGQYYWGATAQDSAGSTFTNALSTTKSDQRVIDIEDPPATCDIKPINGGTSPLIVKVTNTSTSDATSLDFGDKSTQVTPFKSGAVIYHNYTTADTYNIVMTFSPTISCSKTVKVTQPTSSSGTEVTP